MIRASITPGMARTLSNSSSVSMVAPAILCRRSERRRAPVRAGLRVSRFPRGPPRSTGPGEDQDVITVRLDPEHLVTTGQGLSSREPEHLAGRTPDFQFLPVLIPKCRHHSLHRHCLLSGRKDVSHPFSVTVGPGNVASRTPPTGCAQRVLPRLSAAFRRPLRTGGGSAGTSGSKGY